MITYTKNAYDSCSGVYVTGTSSGAMMTNVLAATYPELIDAGSVVSGVAAGCFYSVTGGVDAWNSTCSTGASIASAALWASIAEAMYPGYTGARPKMQLWHGTADTTLAPQNLIEEIKQWTGVFNVSETLTSTFQNSPEINYTTSNYGSNVQSISAGGEGHAIPVNETVILSWFGIA
jgi:acetylxylan esterase